MAAKEEEATPVYDDTVRAVIAALDQGKTREQLAQERGHTSYRSLESYMRRRHFRWNPERQNYEPIPSKRSTEEDAPSTSKAGQVVAMLGREGADPKTVARRLGFKDHREMAAYMKGHGYRYDSEQQHYVRQYGANDTEPTEEPPVENGEAVEENLRRGRATGQPVDGAGWERYVRLLELLLKNEERLIDLVVPGGKAGRVPRYTVPGTPVTKSIHMSHLVDRMVRDYSTEKNISQRDIVQTALLEFFKKYGYEREVEVLIGS